MCCVNIYLENKKKTGEKSWHTRIWRSSSFAYSYRRTECKIRVYTAYYVEEFSSQLRLCVRVGGLLLWHMPPPTSNMHARAGSKLYVRHTYVVQGDKLSWAAITEPCEDNESQFNFFVEPATGFLRTVVVSCN